MVLFFEMEEERGVHLYAPPLDQRGEVVTKT
jgi:hypothetical protein